MPYFFQVPFAVSGDRTTVPVPTQVDGSINYTEGYGPDYQLPRATDPAALTIERNKFNQLYYAITSNIQQYQTHGTPEYITSSDNGGSPYAYSKYARVRYDNGSEVADYISLVNSNTALPTVGANWAQIRIDPAYLGIAQTFTAIQTVAAAGTPIIINSTDSTVLKITMKDGATNRGGIGASSIYSAAVYLSNLTTIAGGWDASGNLVPGAAAAYDIGASGASWRNMFSNRYTVLGNTAPTNGLYLPAANTVGISANSTLVAAFTSTGMNQTVIGATSPAPGTFTTATANSFVPNSATAPTNGLYLAAANTPAIAVNGAIGVAFGAGSIGPNATQRHTLPAVASDTIALLSAPQTLSAKTIDASNTVRGYRPLTSFSSSFTLGLTDMGNTIGGTSASATVVTIPLNSSVAAPIGSEIDFYQYGTGQVSFAVTAGVTLRSKSGYVKMGSQYSGATLKKIGTDEWILWGDLVA